MYFNKFFFEKFYHNNVQVVPSINSISLSFFNKDKDIVFLGASGLYLITNKKPTLLTRRLSKRRNARSDLVGCSVVLKKKTALDFFKYLNLIVFPNMLNFEGLKIQTNTFNDNKFLYFDIDNLLVFPELNRELDKFYTLKNLSININFSHENYLFLSQLNNFPVISK